MGQDITFSVNGKPKQTDKSQLSVETLLLMGGVNKREIEQYVLVSGDGSLHQNLKDVIEVHPGENFEVKKRDGARPTPGVIHYKVNGEEQTTDKNPLTVEDILEKAGSAAGIYKDEIGNYFLEELEGDGKRYKNSSDSVTVKEGDHFLAVHIGKTPVA